MKPYVAVNPFGAMVLVLSKESSLLHSRDRGLYVDKPVACVKNKTSVEHAIAHMMACAVYSGADENAVAILRTLKPFTKHEEILISASVERMRLHRVQQNAKENLPSKAKAMLAHIEAGLADGEIWEKMRTDYGLPEKDRKGIVASIEKARAKAAEKSKTKKQKVREAIKSAQQALPLQPQKRTTKKKG